MKPRHQLSAAEVTALHAVLERRLEDVGVVSQPEIVVRLLKLVSDPRSALHDFAKIIKNDAAVAGRVLKLANSALFAQRMQVTSLERACLVLGLERLKSISLGFHLSRAAAGGADLSRKVWGESLLRACLAAELARKCAPTHVPEAFVIGLMLDAGLPLMGRLLGSAYEGVYSKHTTPAGLLRAESESLGFTHVDVITVLAKRWQFPELLSRPLELHHARPADGRSDAALARLHRIAYAVGQIEFAASETGVPEARGPVVADRLLGLSQDDVAESVRRSAAEYSVNMALFHDVAQPLAMGQDLLDRVQMRLIEAVDFGVEQSIGAEQRAQPARFTINGRGVELVRERDGGAVAYLYDGQGNRLISHRFHPRGTSAMSVCDALGIDGASNDDVRGLEDRLRSLAA